MFERRRRVIAMIVALLLVFLGFSYEAVQDKFVNESATETNNVLGSTESTQNVHSQLATEALDEVEVKGRAPKTGYSREQFGGGWADLGPCDMRNFILERDLTDVVTLSEEDCTVLTGTLQDPYTGKTIEFERGAAGTSGDVQIDHVVALSDAWQKGAQQLSYEKRQQFANDTLNLLAVDGSANQQKSDSDAASWLPSNKDYRCRYVARQIAVKQKYGLWITGAEKTAIQRVLSACPNQQLPIVQ